MSNYWDSTFRLIGGEAYQRTQEILDLRAFEIKYETAHDLLMNPPPASSSSKVHNKYRREANDALEWIKSNLPSKYNYYEDIFIRYIREVTPANERGLWSESVWDESGCYTGKREKYSHHYSRGSQATLAEKTNKVRREIIALPSTSLMYLADSTLNTNMIPCMREHNMSADMTERERRYRAEHKLPDTPPERRKFTPMSKK